MSANQRQVMRKNSFKKGITGDSARRAREGKNISIRKNKRMEQTQKRRNLRAAAVPETTDAAGTVTTTTPKTPLPTVADLPRLVAGVRGTDVAQIFEAVQGIRRMLSKETDPPAVQVIQAGIIPDLVKFLGRNDHHKLQFEAAWALTNIASTEHTSVIVENNAVPPLAALLKHADPDVREQSLWCLGNVSGDGPAMRDMVLSTQALQGVLLNIQHPHNISMLRNATWTLSNFCRGKPQPDIRMLAPALPLLKKLIEQPDKEVLADACWAFSYLSDGEDERIQAVVNTGAVNSLIKQLGHDSASVVTPALRTLGNIVSGNDACTQNVIECGMIQACMSLLSHSKKGIRKETCWALSNIAAGNTQQVAALVSCQNVMRAVIHVAENDDWDVRKEAAWVVSNVCTGGQPEHVRAIVTMGALKALVSLLDVADVKIVGVALDALEATLQKGGEESEYDVAIDELGGVDLLEKLQEHDCEAIYEKAVKIIDTYYSADDEDDDENLAPSNAGNQFTFGVTAKPAVCGGNQQNGAIAFGNSNVFGQQFTGFA